MTITVHHGDNRDVIKTIADNSIDAVVTDPPYALVSIVKGLGRWPANVILDGSTEAALPFRREDGDTAARFFYSAKASTEDRIGSKHPTIKPVDLMAWLVRLVTPPGGVVLDPFAGSGSTGGACIREGFDAILIEREAEYIADIRRRIDRGRGLDGPLFAANDGLGLPLDLRPYPACALRFHLALIAGELAHRDGGGGDRRGFDPLRAGAERRCGRGQ